jgi:hypothetical protein
MGCSETTATASSGILLTNDGVFFEHEVRKKPKVMAVSNRSLFIEIDLETGFELYKDTINNHLIRTFHFQYN